jgi:hypothetical protein
MWLKLKGEWCLRQRILKLGQDGRMRAKCDKCGEDVPVPWLAVNQPETTRRRMILRVPLDGPPKS